MVEVTESVIEKLEYRRHPGPMVAVVDTAAAAQPAVELRRGDLAVVCAGLEKPGNVGAILRTADAAGVRAAAVDNEHFDLFNPNAIRASTGAVFTVPVLREPADVLLERFRAAKLPVIALTGEADRRYTDVDWTAGGAAVLGAEAEGLTDAWRQAADEAAAIPMRGVVDSLNVAATAAAALFEAARQRDAPQ